ncbi:MAG: hypothetical protein ACKVU0_08340 [Saprospiraceae bacterium]
MSTPAHIYLSFDPADARTAADLQRQLALALQPRPTVFWNKAVVPTEAFRTEAAKFLEKSDLFVALLSMHYEDTPDVRWEAAQAVMTQGSRPSLQILLVQARSASIPTDLQPFQTALPPGETIENEDIARDRQLLRATATATSVLNAAPRSNDIGIGHIELPISIGDLRERLLAQTDRINHAPLLALLKRLIRDVQVKRGVLDVQDSFKHLREKTRLSQISLAELKEKAAPIQDDLFNLIERLQEEDLVPEWRQIFIRDYYRFVADSREDSTVPPFFVPVDDIAIPESLNLPVGPREQESLEQIGLLSFEQKTDFRRSLLLAKDAMAVKNYSQAYAYCDHVRTKVDPQSAQLYEYLLITFLQKETALRAMQEAVNGNDRLLQYVLLYASRLRDYEREGKCPSSTSLHNLSIASEGISDAALRLYHALPNDPLRHTGKHAESVPDNRRPLRIILGNTLKVCRLVHPSEELLEAAVIECCGGGKCAWIERVDVVNGRFQFVPNGHFDLLGEIQELLGMLQDIESSDEAKIVKDPGLLREDLYFSLLAKRQALSTQIAEDEKRRRPFTDIRESVVRFSYACLLGAEIFTDRDERGRGTSFYRLALEYLLPGLLDSPTHISGADLRWFTLNELGEVVAHPDCAKYNFDVQAIVEKIVQDHAGQAGWLQVQPNIKQSVYLQFVADTQAEWEAVKNNLAHTDFRRMESLDARRMLIDCLRRWRIIYRAYPERSGQDYLDHCIREISGEHLLVWLQFDATGQLATLPDSLALGYDAQSELRELLSESTRYTEEDLRRSISEHIFQKQILPEYEAIRTGEETQRNACARLLGAAICAFKLQENYSFLDFVWRELTEEIKFRWVDVTNEGEAVAYKITPGFDPLLVLRELHEAMPKRFRLYQLRERVAMQRFRDTEARYFHEISEFRHENRLPERQVAVEIIRKLKGLYRYFPQAEFLKLPMDELHGRGRVRWHAKVFGFFPTTENHYENSYFNFEYKFERYELKNLLDNQFGEMQRVLQETGEL